MKKEASIQHALEEIERMPGIGPKSAQRILNWLLTSDDEVALGIAEAIVDVKKAIHLCPRCHNFAEGELCAICADPSRESETICVVAEPRDVEAIERTGIYQGLYHVLGGVLVATNPDVEGETTASYLARIIKPLGIRVTRLASGLPVGGELEYADEVTLGRAIESRREL